MMKLLICVLVLVLLITPSYVSAFCNDLYIHRFPIINVTDKPNPFLVNGTSGVMIDNYKQLIWCSENSNYLCYNDYTDYACYNNDTKTTTLVDEGNGTSFGGINNLEAFYSMKNTNTINNESFSCVPHSDAIITSNGKIGNAYDFSGDGRLNCSAMPSFTNHNKLSIEYWVYFDVLSTNSTHDYYTISDRGTSARTDGINNMHTFFGTSAGFSEADGSGNIVTDQWYHYSIDWDGANFYSYLNGVQDWSASRGGTLDEHTATYPNFYIGGHRSYSVGSTNGRIDNVMIWSKSRGALELNLSYYSISEDTISLGSIETFIMPALTGVSNSWCEGLYLHEIEYENKTVNNDNTITIIETVKYCKYGCGEGTYMHGDECYQAPIVTMSSAFILIIVFISLIFIIPYTLQKKKKKRGR